MDDANPVIWFGWFRPDILVEYKQLFWAGTLMTVGMTIACIAMGIMLGLLLALARLADARHQPWKGIFKYALRWPSTVYVSFFRGTPLFVQILLVHFAFMPVLINPSDGLLVSGEAARELRQEHGAFLSGVLALTLNAAAYISEIVRAGIQSIARGQVQAAQSLGMNDQQAMRLIILPQALRRMVPPLVNESITLLKDSSLVSAIGLAELAMAARTVAGAYSRYWEPYLAISAVYLVLTGILTLLARRLETPADMRGR